MILLLKKVDIVPALRSDVIVTSYYDIYVLYSNLADNHLWKKTIKSKNED